MSWEGYGSGKVTPDGSQIVPDADTRIYALTGMAVPIDCWGTPLFSPVCILCAIAAIFGGSGDPVDLATELYIQEHTDLSVDDVMPIEVRRAYQSGDLNVRHFGVGMMLNYDMYRFGSAILDFRSVPSLTAQRPLKRGYWALECSPRRHGRAAPLTIATVPILRQDRQTPHGHAACLSLSLRLGFRCPC
jgi:hypothetical protein